MSNLHQRWAGLKPPLRPNAEVVFALRDAIAGWDGCVLQLGVTPELAEIGTTTVAVDICDRMIALAWPGNTRTRRAIRGNWLDMPLRRREYTSVIGDGSFGFARLSDYAALFEQLDRLLLPGAAFAVRFYVTPDECETLNDLRQNVMAGNGGGFHAFKWRLAMAIATKMQDANVPVMLIHRLFEREFPDRAALGAATGWTLEQIAEIDNYVGQNTVYSFPTRREILAKVPQHYSNPHFISSGTYELAERCPILVANFEG